MSIETAGIGRRAVVRGAAWTAPAIILVSAAPAHASTSPACQPIAQTIDWGSAHYVRGGSRSGTYTLPDPDGAGVQQGLTLSVGTSYLGSNTQTGNQARTADDNLRVSAGAIGGTGDSGLTLHQSPIYDSLKTFDLDDRNKSITTFTFSRPVTDLRFTLCDIDSANQDFQDVVGLDGADFTAQIVDPGHLGGSGTPTDPLYTLSMHAPVLDSATTGNVRISMPSVTAFSLHYWNATDAYSSNIDGDQKLFVSDFTFSYEPC